MGLTDLRWGRERRLHYCCSRLEGKLACCYQISLLLHFQVPFGESRITATLTLTLINWKPRKEKKERKKRLACLLLQHSPIRLTSADLRPRPDLWLSRRNLCSNRKPPNSWNYSQKPVFSPYGHSLIFYSLACKRVLSLALPTASGYQEISRDCSTVLYTKQ